MTWLDSNPDLSLGECLSLLRIDSTRVAELTGLSLAVVEWAVAGEQVAHGQQLLIRVALNRCWDKGTGGERQVAARDAAYELERARLDAVLAIRAGDGAAYARLQGSVSRALRTAARYVKLGKVLA